MSTIVAFCIDKYLYHAADTEHDLFLVTTEYRYKSELLVHVQIGKNLGVRLNDQFSNLLEGKTLQNEQFLFKKAYQDAPKRITRKTFDEKIKRFNMCQTVIEMEILEDYTYTNKNNQADHVQIVIFDNSDTVAVTIEFTDTEQYENFVYPAWLVKAEKQ